MDNFHIFLGATVADAATRPLHWVYNPKKLNQYIKGKKEITFLKKNKSSHTGILENLLDTSAKLETLSSPREIVFGHNDFLAANFLDDGSKIWVVDWEYGGFNDPLFDIGGLASNNDFDQDQEKETLEMYYEKPIDNNVLLRYNAMKTASLLRETMWSMVSELTSKIDFDYGEYTKENLNKFDQAYGSL